MGWLPVPVILILLVTGGGCWFWLRGKGKMDVRTMLCFRTSSDWRRILLQFLLAVPGLVLLLWLFRPSLLWSLMMHQPRIWLLVMVAYPLVSVLPQELVYRVFFFERYQPLFGRGTLMILASAVAFGCAHLVFRSWPSVVLTLIGGVLFAVSYHRNVSWLMASVEHALYGCALFTIGFGQYFLDGTLRLIQP